MKLAQAIAMTSGDERNVVYKYMQKLLGRPVYTHELAQKSVMKKLHEKSKADFIELCKGK